MAKTNTTKSIQIIQGGPPSMTGQPPAGPQVDYPVAFVPAGDTVTWACKDCDKDDYWLVTFPGQSPFKGGEKVFTPQHSTSSPVKAVRPPKLFKYLVATRWGVLDPHIIPMP